MPVRTVALARVWSAAALGAASAALAAPARLSAQAAGAAPAAASAPAQAPNFSGTWAIDVRRSDFGGRTPPFTRLAMRVRHAGTALEFDVLRDDAMTGKDTRRYVVNGATSTDTSQPGFEVRTTARFDGPVLVIREQTRHTDSDVTRTERWSLSGDGRTLTVARTLTSDTWTGGFPPMRWVFARQ